jgi:hypothetical protein
MLRPVSVLFLDESHAEELIKALRPLDIFAPQYQ